MIVAYLVKLGLLAALFGRSFSRNACRQHLKELGVIPDKADGVKSTKLDLSFNGKTVKCMDSVQLVDAVKAPTLKLDVTDRCPNVTLISYIADGIVGPAYMRWIVINIPSSEMKKGYNNAGGLADNGQPGDVKSAYTAPKDATSVAGRPNNIVYLLYCQCRYINDTKPFLIPDKYNFDIKGYAKDSGLYCPVVGFTYMAAAAPVGVKSPVDIPAVPLPDVIPKLGFVPDTGLPPTL